MTSVHNEPHPLAQRYIKPNNPEIASKFGVVRIEDWDDRISGYPWPVLRDQGANSSVESYVAQVNATDRSVLAPAALFDVVRCHTQSTGELVLLHDEWVKTGKVIA